MEGRESNDPLRGARIPGGRVCAFTAASRSGGFTLVELISVMILLSILGIFAMARMTSPELFAPAVVSGAVAAEVRFARQLAAARSDAVVSVTVDRVGDAWRLRTSSDVDGVVRTELVSADDTALQAASGAVSASLDAATALTLVFDHAGDLATVLIGAAPGAPDSGVNLTVAGDSTRRLCVYPSGYAHAGACS